MCNKINKKAGKKTAFLKTENITKLSLRIKTKRDIQLTISPSFINLFFVVLKTCIMAISETETNK